MSHIGLYWPVIWNHRLEFQITRFIILCIIVVAIFVYRSHLAAPSYQFFIANSKHVFELSIWIVVLENRNLLRLIIDDNYHYSLTRQCLSSVTKSRTFKMDLKINKQPSDRLLNLLYRFVLWKPTPKEFFFLGWGGGEKQTIGTNAIETLLIKIIPLYRSAILCLYKY